MSVARAPAAADDKRSKHQLDATAKSVPCAATTSSNNTRLLDYDRAFTEGLPIATSLRNGCSSRSNVEKRAQFDPALHPPQRAVGPVPRASRSSRLTSARRYPDTDDGATPRRRQRDHAILDLHPRVPAAVVAKK
jgi:hypothetical protein